MSFNRLTIQSLQAARQRAAYMGMSGLGKSQFDAAAYDQRPSIDYVKAGDVIRVYIAINPGLYFGGADESAKFAQEIKSAFNVVRAPADASGYFGSRAWVVDVQPRSDYSRLQDATSVVLHAAQESGLNVNAGTSYGQFVSKVETTGITPPTSLPIPGAPSGNTPSVTDSFSSFFSGLTSSPVTLAVILGAAVVLVIAAKK